MLQRHTLGHIKSKTLEGSISFFSPHISKSKNTRYPSQFRVVYAPTKRALDIVTFNWLFSHP